MGGSIVHTYALFDAQIHWKQHSVTSATGRETTTGEHEVILKIHGKGVEGYAFTFGG